MKSNSKLPDLFKATCLNCFEKSTILLRWRPPTGIDPHLRSFSCQRCGFIFYKRLPMKAGVLEIEQPIKDSGIYLSRLI